MNETALPEQLNLWVELLTYVITQRLGWQVKEVKDLEMAMLMAADTPTISKESEQVFTLTYTPQFVESHYT